MFLQQNTKSSAVELGHTLQEALRCGKFEDPSSAVDHHVSLHQVEGEVDYRLRQKAALQTMLKEKMLELDRQNLQYQSLLRIESEQLALIDRLSNSETLTEEEAPRK